MILTRRNLLIGSTTGLIASPALAIRRRGSALPTVGGLQINLVPFTNWSSAPADYQTKMQTAANILMAAFPNTHATINIQVEYGTCDGATVGNKNSASVDVSTSFTSYSSIKTALAATSNQTSELASVISNLPSSSLGGQSVFNTSFAVCKAISLFPSDGPANATDPALDGYVGLGTNWTPAETLGTCLHELRQAMGGIVQRATFVFSRFRSPGVWDASAFFTTAYFSLDGGTTNLATFDGTSDFADLVNGTTDPGSGLWDCFDASSNGPGGTLQGLSPLGLKMMRATGFR